MVRDLFATTTSKRMQPMGYQPVQKGFISPMRTVPASISRPEYAQSGRPHNASHVLACYEAEELPAIRDAARLARRMLEFAKTLARPGVSTDEIDALTHDEILRCGAYPTPLNYCGFPKSICTSVNEVACHGIPDSRPLMRGDLVSIDVSLFLNGVHGDNCGVALVVDDTNDEKQKEKYAAQLRLIEATEMAVMNAIGICQPGRCLTEIGEVIEVNQSTRIS